MALADIDNYEGCLGDFMHKETRIRFSYAPRGDKFGSYNPELTHIVYVGDGTVDEIRLALVRKTIAYILVDEDMLEKWPITQHKVYAPLAERTKA